MLLRLVEPLPKPPSRAAADASREVVYRWLRCIYVDESWNETREKSGVSAASAVRACIASLGPWTLRLARDIVHGDGYEDVREVYGALVLDAEQAMGEGRAVAPKASQPSAEALVLLEAWEKGKPDGLTWVPRPRSMIGPTARRHVAVDAR